MITLIVTLLQVLLNSIFIVFKALTVFHIYWLFKYTWKLVKSRFTVFKALTIFHI